MTLFCYYLLGIVPILSLVSFVMYGYDKRKAKLEGNRVAEKSLHMVNMVGGWPGGLAGSRYFRHKTQKLSFRIVYWLTVAIHVLLMAVWLYLIWKY